MIDMEDLSLIAIGWSLVHFLWQGLLIGLVVAIALKFTPERACRARYVIATAGMAMLPLLFVGTLIGVLNDGLVATSIGQWAHSGESWLNGFSIGWLIGAAIFSLRLVRKSIFAGRLKWRGIQRPADEWLLIFSELKKRFGLSPAIPLFESRLISTPMVVGWFSPVVLSPVGMMCALSPAEVRAILAHELAHLKRYDHLVNLFQELIEVMFFFHPVTWWLSSKIREEREYCSDALAVRMGGDALALAKSLTFLASCRHLNSPALAASDGPLRKRISRLLPVKDSDQPDCQTKPIPENMKSKRLLKTAILTISAIALFALMSVLDRATEKTLEIPVTGIPESEIPEVPGLFFEEAEESDGQVIHIVSRFIEVSGGGIEVIREFQNQSEPSAVNVMSEPESERFLKQLSSQAGVDMLSTPTVISRAGAKATVRVARRVPVTQNGIDSDRREVNLGLETHFLPRVSKNGDSIDIDVFSQLVSLAGFDSQEESEESARYDCQTISTIANVPPGQTAVIGGGTREDQMIVTDIVPLLGDIPFLGRLFRTTELHSESRQLFMMVTPTLVDESGRAKY